MRAKSLGDLFHWFKARSIDWILASVGPQQAAQAFTITGGGTGTDAVTLTSQSMGGQTCKEMADTTYQVLLGSQANQTLYVASKTASGFSILGLGSSEKVDVLVVGRLLGMREELEV